MCGQNHRDSNMSLPSITTQFLREFENFDGRCVNSALASLAADAALLSRRSVDWGYPRA